MGLIQARYSMVDDSLRRSARPGLPQHPGRSRGSVLGGLQPNGGPTDTRALLNGSRGIDEGEDASCGATDQRGLGRPRGAHCDIGAYERAASLTVNTFADDFDTCTAAGCSLREAVEFAGVGGTVAVPAGEYVLSRGSLDIVRSVVIQGAGARSTTLRGSGERVLTITGGGSIVSGVRITGGNASEGQPFGGQGGGVSIEGAELNLVDSTVDGNVAGVGGGIFTAGGFFSATGSTIAANQATHGRPGSEAACI